MDYGLQKYGKIDFLVLNAAVNPAVRPLGKTTPQQMDKIYGTNIKSNVLLIQSIVPHMAPGSSILFINSISAYFPDDSIGLTVGMYAVSKTAMLGMVKAMSQEYANRNIRVNGISSGIVPTSFGSILTTPDAKAYYVCRSCCQSLCCTVWSVIKPPNILRTYTCNTNAATSNVDAGATDVCVQLLAKLYTLVVQRQVRSVCRRPRFCSSATQQWRR